MSRRRDTFCRPACDHPALEWAGIVVLSRNTLAPALTANTVR
jgi:hypothetical protein